jgi:hypothetical protein
LYQKRERLIGEQVIELVKRQPPIGALSVKQLIQKGRARCAKRAGGKAITEQASV